MKYLILVFLIVLIGLIIFGTRNKNKVNNYHLSEDNSLPKGIAIIGDSQSDEYKDDDRRGGEYENVTYNWVEILAKYRNLNLGKWGNWGEPRREGYEFNWSRSGAIVNTVLQSNAHKGVAEQVKEGKVDTVIIYIGANDFAPYNPQGYRVVYTGEISGQRLDGKIEEIIIDLDTIVETVQKSGNPKILIITIPDWNNHLAIQKAFPDILGREKVSNTIKSVNAKIERLSREKNVPVADVNKFYLNLIKSKESQMLEIDGIKLDRIEPGDNPKSEFLGDGIHPGTVLNGLFANFIIQNLNSEFKYAVDELTTEEIKQITKH